MILAAGAVAGVALGELDGHIALGTGGAVDQAVVSAGDAPDPPPLQVSTVGRAAARWSRRGYRLWVGMVKVYRPVPHWLAMDRQANPEYPCEHGENGRGSPPVRLERCEPLHCVAAFTLGCPQCKPIRFCLHMAQQCKETGIAPMISSPTTCYSMMCRMSSATYRRFLAWPVASRKIPSDSSRRRAAIAV